MDGSTLPLFGNPSLWKFRLLELVPTFVFMFVMWICSVVYLLFFSFKPAVKLLCGNSEHCKTCLSCLQRFDKWIDEHLGTISVIVFPRLFSMKHISVASESLPSRSLLSQSVPFEPELSAVNVQPNGRKYVKEILFLDRTTKSDTHDSRKTFFIYSIVLIRVFGMLGSIILLFSAVAFFRYFPVTLGTQCVEEDGKFNTWFCYHANASNSDQAINCTLYNINNPPDKSNSSALICYAISGELAKSSAAALGLYKISSICVLFAVHIALILDRLCGKVCKHKWFNKMFNCEKHPRTIKLCYVCGYSLACFVLFLAIGVILLYRYIINSISNEYTFNHYFTGEFMYGVSLVSIFFILAIFFLIIPCNMLICYKGINSSYYFLASEGEEEFQDTDSDSESDNGYDEIGQSGENEVLA